MNKKILIAGLLTLASVAGVVGTVGNAHKVGAASDDYIYLKPNTKWQEANARYAAYFFETGKAEKWVGMTDNDGDGYYEAIVPDGYTNIIFCRMNPSTTANNWDNKWNQSSDLKVPTDGTDCYTVKANTWDNGGGTWSTLSHSDNVKKIFTNAYNSGRYVRETEIYLNKEHAEYDIAKYFHAKADDLVRTTYFDGEYLWMTNNNGVNSGYGINEKGEMNHFKFENGKKVVDYTVPGTKGPENYYVTLLDIKESIVSSQNWKRVAEKTYSSSDASLIKKFGSFTAPCFLGFEDNQANLLSFDRVEIEEKSNTYELRLYVKSDSKGWVTDQSSLLFSKATISSITSSAALPSSINDWNTNYCLTPTDKTGIYYCELELSAATYQFKLFVNGNWHGNPGTYDSKQFGNAWDFWGDNPSNCALVISEKARYGITIDTNATYPKVSINKLS